MEENLIALGAVVGGTFLVLLWASLIVWTYRDIRDRTRDLAMQVLSVFLVMAFSLLGLLLYLILRPRETMEEAYARSLEEEALLREMGEDSACPSCRRFVDSDYLFCPHCQTQLRQPCPSCGRPLSFSWIACPTCGSARPTPEKPTAPTAAGVSGVTPMPPTRPETAEPNREEPAVAPGEANPPGTVEMPPYQH